VNIIIGVKKQDNLEAAGEYIKAEFQNEIFYKNSKYETYWENYSKKNTEVIENLTNNFGFSDITKTNLSQQCWIDIDRAIDLEHENLVRRHTKTFSEKFSTVELSLDGMLSGKSDSSPSELSGSGDGAGDPLIMKKDIQGISHMFDYGRYLFLSSAGQTVSNLQGIWGDGNGCIYVFIDMHIYV
jgi:hypothetical protein